MAYATSATSVASSSGTRASTSSNYAQVMANRALIIAEKPSVARAIADAMKELGIGTPRRETGYIIVNNFVISWCIGHLLQVANPDAIDPKLAKWQLETIPFFPPKLQYQVNPADYVKAQFNILAQLIKAAPRIIHAGDPDREGQLLVDELFDYLQLPEQQIANIERVIITDLSTEGINKAFRNLKMNYEYSNLSASAAARQQADWYLGMNLSRAVTIYAQQHQFKGALSIGRVFTPLLSMVYNRDMEIENFVPHDFYTLFARIQGVSNQEYQVFYDGQASADPYIIVKFDLLKTFQVQRLADQVINSGTSTGSNSNTAKVEDLVNDPTFGQYVDENGRLINPDYVSQVMSVCEGALGNITKVEQKDSNEAPPLGYALSDLQQAMYNVFNIGVQETLDIVQRLYEQGYVTYPRTDCQYLNDEDFNDRHVIINNLANLAGAIRGLDRIHQGNFNPNQKSRIWNSNKVENHAAITPTTKMPRWDNLDAKEKNAYTLIAQRYLMQFMPPAKYVNFELVAEFRPDDKVYVFGAKTKALVDLGWKVVISSADTLAKAAQAQRASSLLENEETDINGNQVYSEQTKQAMQQQTITKMLSSQAITGINIGDVVQAIDFAVETSQTTPPPRFNDSTLLKAMTNIARYVASPELKKILNEVDGIGTEATRAGIIEKLMTYDYCKKQKSYIITTDIGRGLINSLPAELALPDTTAVWEKQLSLIAKGEVDAHAFMQDIKTGIVQILDKLAQNSNLFNHLAGKISSRSQTSSYQKRSYPRKNGNTGSNSGAKTKGDFGNSPDHNGKRVNYNRSTGATGRKYTRKASNSSNTQSSNSYQRPNYDDTIF